MDAGGYPLVLPTAFAVDADGPDRDGTLYFHGSVAAKWLVAARHSKVCVTVTEVDGLVAARSGFESSMNYRTAVVLGEARVVDDPDERMHALDLMVDHMVPGRAATIRRPTRKELAATQVLALSLWEASLKVRTGGPDDEDDDVADNPWGGHIPLYRVAGAPVGDEGSRGPVPGRRTPSRRADLGRSLGSLHMERTLVLVKPDGVRRGLTGEVLRRIEAKGYTLVRLELREATPELLAEHYAEHEGKPFYGPLVEFMLSGPVAAVVVEGERVVEGFRSLAGATDPTVAAPGTIRGDLGRDWGLAVQQNLVHGSDSPESAAREIGIWFPDL